ncbi:MAG TPA: glycosyltransferase family 87 protein [Kofleriaceae bacterium]|nr:glycosyltransferase family 87 protein [Kofleriaceae bacterium]
MDASGAGSRSAEENGEEGAAGAPGTERAAERGAAGAAGAAGPERTAVALVCLALAGSCAGAGLAAAVARALGAAPLGPAALGTALGIAACCGLGRRRLAARLPAELDGWLRRRRAWGAVWIAVAVLAVANTARIGLFVADPAQVWASATPPIPASVRHQCFAAYVRAGELAAAGQADLWRHADYARPAPGTHADTAIDGLGDYLLDPYEYPPVFAVLPRAAVAATRDYHVLRAAWFAISAAGFWLAFVGVAIWIRGRAGATALLLAPVLALSLPLVINLQFGQAHLIVVAAAMGAMLQFARGRRAAGAVLLALATATKVFPGLLLVHLAVRRQWRDLGATLVALAALVGLAALVLGPATLAAFVTEHVPRMASGEAFSNTEENPDNHALYGLAFKLATLGVPSAGRELGAALAWIWGVLALILAALGSRGRVAPARDAVIWLGVLCLATLRSPFAPMYSAVGTLWLLAVWAGAARPRWWWTAAVAASWAVLQGFPAIFSDPVNVLASFPSQIATIALAVAAVWPRPRAAAP